MILAELHIPVSRKLGACDFCPARFSCFTADEIIVTASNQIENPRSNYMVDMKAEFIVDDLFMRPCVNNNFHLDIRQCVMQGKSYVYVTEVEYDNYSNPQRITIKSLIPR